MFELTLNTYDEHWVTLRGTFDEDTAAEQLDLLRANGLTAEAVPVGAE